MTWMSSTLTAGYESSIRRPLVDDLQAKGIQVIPQDLVDTHKRMEIRKRRPGILRFFGPFGFFLIILAVWPVILDICRRFKTKLPKKLECGLFLATLVMSVASYAILALFGHGVTGAFFLAPVAANALLAFLHTSERLDLLLAIEIWTSARITSSGETAAPNAASQMPKRLYARARLAEEIPGTRLAVEFLDDDPFLVVLRGYGPWTEKAWIGAWKTGNARLDEF